MYDNYASETIEIDGYKTVIIDKEKIASLTGDENFEPSFKPMLQKVSLLDFLDIAFVYIPRYHIRFQWMPVLIYHFEGGAEFVHYSESWMCMDCGYLTGAVLVHQSFHDPYIYTYEELKRIKQRIEKIFPRSKCPQCGHLLQSNPILLYH